MRLYDDFIERFASSKIGSWMFLNVFTHLDRWLIRASGGRLSTGVGSRFHSHGVVLETRGAKSGKLRRVPLVTLISGNDWTLIASATGQAKNPAWYYNLKKNPEAFLYHRGEAIPVFARGGGRTRARPDLCERDRVREQLCRVPRPNGAHHSGHGTLASNRRRVALPGRPRAIALLSHGTKLSHRRAGCHEVLSANKNCTRHPIPLTA